MPRQDTATKARIHNLIACLTPALTLLEELNDAFGPPLIRSIGTTIQALIAGNVKRNKDQCFQLVESIHQVLYPIIHLHLKSETAGSLPPSVLDKIAQFTETLHKIYTFIELQQDRTQIKQFFRQSEVKALLKECHSGVKQAKELFMSQTGFTVLNNVIKVQHEAETMHTELLELILTLSDGTVSDRSSSVFYKKDNGSHTSSNSFSMLPSKPKIFHGRDSELKEILEVLSQDAPRIAILGGGGMGKTSLARTTLHHANICAKFPHRFFVSAEPATTAVELAALVGLHLGLEPGPNLIKPVVRYFTQQKGLCLLILDNLETPWEPTQSRVGVENFLSLLADLEHLALIITMRGSERPGQVRWTRPFLQPLQPLSDEASLQIFEEITDDSHASEEKTQLLEFTENMPLAVDLMAHLVDYEGLTNVLARWKIEKTAALSTGYHRTSNLDTSIALSYSSPRITPGARDLLRLLSILPDGLSDIELTQSNLPIGNIQSSKSVLIATSLAYKDTKSRFRSLVPIREHIQQFSPPSETLVQAIRKSFHDLLALYEKHKDAHLGIILAQITTNLANLEEVLHRGLQPGSSDFSETVQCVVSLNSFCRMTRDGRTTLLSKIPIHLCDHRRSLVYIIEHLRFLRKAEDIEQLVAQGISHLRHLDDATLEARFYTAAGGTFTSFQSSAQHLQFFKKGLELFKSTGDSSGQCNSLTGMARLKWSAGDHRAALRFSRNAQQLGYQTTNLYKVSRAMGTIGSSLCALGDYVGSLNQLNGARELLSLCGITSGPLYHTILTTQAEIHLQKSEYAEARSIHATTLQDTLLDPTSQSYARALFNTSEIDILMGATKQTVHPALDRVRKIFTARNSRLVTYCDMISADLDLREKNDTSARTLFQDCLKLFWAQDIEGVTYCLERLADVTKWPTRFHQPEARWPVVYLCRACKSSEKLATYKALLFIGDVFIAADKATAHSLFTVALEGFTFMDVHRSRAECMVRLGDLALRRGETTQAAELWRSARPLFERSLQAGDVTAIDTRLATLDGKNVAHLTTLCAPTIPVEADAETSNIQVASPEADETVAIVV